MQIPPSTDLFRALGSMPRPGSPAIPARAPEVPRQQPGATAEIHQPGAKPRERAPAQQLAAATPLPANPPPANLPRGSLINLRV